MKFPYLSRKNKSYVQLRRGCGDGGCLPERGEHGEARGRVGVALPRRLLRGRSDGRNEASRASEAVARIEKVKK